jgi:hypothetical protein
MYYYLKQVLAYNHLWFKEGDKWLLEFYYKQVFRIT